MDSKVDNSHVDNKAEGGVDNLSILMDKNIYHVEETLEVATIKKSEEEYVSHLRNQAFRAYPVASRIMKGLDMKDLKAFRQASRTCYNQSKFWWMKHARIHIKCDGENNQTLQEFTTFFQECLNSADEKQIPVENFALSLNGVYACRPELEMFAQICGPHIKSLEFTDERISSKMTEGVEQLFRTLRKLMENAETMHLKSSKSSNLEKILLMGSPLHSLKHLRFTVGKTMQFDFLCKMPALEELVLRKMHDKNSDSALEFYNLFNKLYTFRNFMKKRNPKFLPLKKLDTIEVPKSLAASLIDAKLPLENLAMSLLSTVQESDLANLLDYYAQKLKSVKLLKRTIRDYTPFQHLPLKATFINLKELELWGNMVASLDFLKNTPNLMKLKVDYGCFECPYISGYVRYTPEAFQGDMVKNSAVLLKSRSFYLGSLQEFVTDCKMSSESWNKLTKWMPNLQVLEARIPNNATMWTVCDFLDKLKKLRLRFGSQVDDDGIIGPEGDMTGSRGITKLKYLHSFDLEVECGQGRLTDRSAELGFLKLEHLGSLKLGFSRNLFTEGVIGKLRENIGHVEIYRSCSNRAADEKVERCCEWANFKRVWGIV